MELELLQGIIQRLGEYYYENGDHLPRSPRHCGQKKKCAGISSANSCGLNKECTATPDAEDNEQVPTRLDWETFLVKREQAVMDRKRRVQEKAVVSMKKQLLMDSGYSSILHSNCNSNRGSKAGSPVAMDSERSLKNLDNRPRKWLVCQSGVRAVRIVQDEPNDEAEEESLLVEAVDGQNSITSVHGTMSGVEASQPASPAVSEDTKDPVTSLPKANDSKKSTVSAQKVGEPSTADEHDVLKSNGGGASVEKSPDKDDIVLNKYKMSSSLKSKDRKEEPKNQGNRETSEKRETAIADQPPVKPLALSPQKYIRVELEDTGQIIEVEERFLEEAGKSVQSNVADLLDLEVCSESEVVATLANRFTQGEYQTKVGPSLISVNPMRRTDSGCGRTARKRSGMSSDPLPLLDQVEQVYRKAILSNKTQSLVFTGRSGSGKTCNYKQALAYLIESVPHQADCRMSMEKMFAIDCLLESFCSTRTCLNTHATRLVQLMELQFTRNGELAGGGLEMALPDTGRLLRSGRLTGEPTFPILYQVEAALGKSDLFLPRKLLTKNGFFTPLQEEVETATALEDWRRVCNAMQALQITQEEEDAFWIILAAITNLGYVAYQLEKGESEPDQQAMEKIINLLGVKQDDIKLILCRPNTPRTVSPACSITTSTASSRVSTPSPTATLKKSPSVWSGISCPDAPLPVDNVRRLAVNLYSELLSRLITYINRSIKSSLKQPHGILLFDSPGFQNPSTVGDKSAGGFVELSYNYLQEKLQEMFRSVVLDNVKPSQKNIKQFFNHRVAPGPLINLLERNTAKDKYSRKETNTLNRRPSKRVRFHNSAPGLFYLLHKAANCPWSDDQVFLERLMSNWGSACNGSLLERTGLTEFRLKHSHGTNPVRYNVQGWRHISYSMGRTNLATEILRKTTRSELKNNNPGLYLYNGIGLNNKALTLAEVKARMSCLQVQVQVDTIVGLLAGTEPNFVFCLLPHNLAGLCELFRKSPGRNSNQRLIRDQLRGFQILDYLTCLSNSPSGGKSTLRISSDHLSMLTKADKDGSGPPLFCQEEDRSRRGLASELWHVLQLAVIQAVSNLDYLESYFFSTMSRTVSLPAPPIAQVLDDTGLLLMQNGKISLNVDGLLDAS